LRFEEDRSVKEQPGGDGPGFLQPGQMLFPGGRQHQLAAVQTRQIVGTGGGAGD